MRTILADLQDDSARALHCTPRGWLNNRAVVSCSLSTSLRNIHQTVAQEKQRCFIELLVTAATEVDGPALITATLRADFYDRPMRYPQLYQ